MKKIKNSTYYGKENVEYLEKQKRECHDCGAKTWDYRCAKCQIKWRKKHGVNIHPKTE